MADQSGTGEAADRTAIASYVATLSADLSVMARRGGLDTLGYLLDMVRLEAENLARHTPHGANGGR
jgi:hypothetical protein